MSTVDMVERLADTLAMVGFGIIAVGMIPVVIGIILLVMLQLFLEGV